MGLMGIFILPTSIFRFQIGTQYLVKILHEPMDFDSSVFSEQ